MPVHARKLFGPLRQIAIACGVTLSIAHAHAQSVDCYDRALAMPKIVTVAMADGCHAKVSSENTTNDRHAIALYNAARFYVALGEREEDGTLKAAAYDSAIADILESRDRAGDANIAFTNPWHKGDKRSQAAQMAANRLLVANRSYVLGKAYFELGKLNGARACPAQGPCFEMAAAELENDASARAEGAILDDYIFLRASVYLAWGQTTPARRDLELLKVSPTYGAAAAQKLGEMFLADAQRHLVPPFTTSGILAARLSYKAALGLPSSAVAGQLGLAETFLLEAQLVEEAGERRARYTDAAREFALAVAETTHQERVADRLRAHEGRGTAFFELARLGDAQALGLAIRDLQTASGLDAALGGAPAQLMLARALCEAGREPEADAAYAEAARRFGTDPRAALARAEQAFARGRVFFAGADNERARDQFQRALAEAGWREGRADAYFFLSAIDLRAGRNAVANADAATAAGGGASPYREQACLARVAAGGQAVQKKTALPACAGSDILLGLFFLRHAQVAPTAAIANDSRRLAQDAFVRARTSEGRLGISPVSGGLRVSDLAAFGSAVALGCSSAAGLNVPVDLDAAQLDAAKAFFTLHRVHACIATN